MCVERVFKFLVNLRRSEADSGRVDLLLNKEQWTNHATYLP